MAAPAVHAFSPSLLPHLSTLDSTISFSTTVSPFLHQLRTVPLSLWENGTANFVQNFLATYHSTNPLISALLFSQVIALLTFFTAEVTRNYSQVDRLWSILPALYVGHFTYFAHYLGLDATRLDTLSVLVGLWAVRLTYNYFRKGGYSYGHEDYRWEIVRKTILPKYTGTLFNLTFIAIYQNLLLLAASAPAYIMLLIATLPKQVSESAAGGYVPTADLVFSRGIMLALIAEFFADQQQWRFHQTKAHYSKHGSLPEGSKFSLSDITRGFCVTGLWSFSRHPNFLAEQTFWVLIYQWVCFITDSLYNWTGVGALSYCMVFQVSTWLTEKISAGKYPEYKDYQRLVARFVPRLSAFYGRGEDVAEPEPVVEDKKKK